MSELEDRLGMQIKAMCLPVPVREYVFASPRKWRFDFAWSDYKIAVEIEGGIYSSRSGHRSYTGIKRDIEKYNEAALLGWLVIRVTREMIESGAAIDVISKILGKVMF